MIIRVALLAVLVSLVRGDPVWADPSKSPSESTRRMAERLAELVRTIDPMKNPFMNDARAEVYRRKLAEAAGPKEAIELRFALATELLNAGRSEEALAAAEPLLSLSAEEQAVAPPDLARRVRAFIGMGHLRLGEQQNCIAQHNQDSCLFPISGEGVHKLQEGSRAAIKDFTQLLEADPNDLTSRWLLNIAYMTVGEYPDGVPARWLIAPKLFDSEYELPRFYDRSAAVGVQARGHAGGVVMEDLDGDGLLDLMVSSMGMTDPMHFYRNNGDGTFSDRTEAAGLTGELGGLNLAHADYDNDGDVDVLVLRGGWMGEGGGLPKSLLRNNGNGTFENVTEAAGLLRLFPTQAGTFGDYDGDGWLDLFLGNELGESDLFHNERDGTFKLDTTSLPRKLGFVKGAGWGDFNNDGRLDLYVSVFLADNFLFRNDGPAAAGASAPVRFTDVSREAGVTAPRFSFGTWFWDYDSDGWLDLYVSGFSSYGIGGTKVDDVAGQVLGLPNQVETPRLYRNNRNGTFTDATRTAKLDRVGLIMGSNHGDVDNDGRPDLYLGTGEPDLQTLVPNRLFRQSETGVFQDVTSTLGVGHLQKGHGIAFGDIDNDGDQDIYESMGGAFLGDLSHNVLYENPGHGHHWITLFLEGRKANRSAIGARIHVRVREPGGTRDIHVLANTGGSFGSSSLRQEIGLGQAQLIEQIEITWPGSGTRQTFRDPPIDAAVRIVEGGEKLETIKLPAFALARGADSHAEHAGHSGH